MSNNDENKIKLVKRDLVEYVSRHYDLKKSDALISIDMVLDSIKNQITNVSFVEKKDLTLVVAGFGTFKIKIKPPHEKLSNLKKERIMVEESRTLRFVPSVNWKAELKKKK